MSPAPRSPDPAFTAALERLLAPGETHWLAAVSGGADSIYLLEQAARQALARKARLAVLHVNYGLRGVEADRDELLVRRRAGELGLPLRVVDCRWRQAPTGNLQAVARQLRRTHLLAARGAEGLILLGHHAQDQGESLVAALAKGKSPLVGRGMQAREGPWLRPLLEHPAPWIRKRCHALSLVWREDASNLSESFERNCLRKVWLPALGGRRGAEAELLLARLGKALREIQREIEDLASEMIDCLDLRQNAVGWSLERAPFLQYHDAVSRAALCQLARRLGLWSRDPSRHWMEHGLDFVRQGRPGSRLTIGRSWMAEAARRRIWLVDRQIVQVSSLLEPGHCGQLDGTWLGWGPDGSAEAWRWRPTRAEAAGRLEIRRWQAGDRLRVGPQLVRRVADLMGERGDAPSQKRLQWVVTVDGEPRWCPGLGADWRPGDEEDVMQHAIWVEPWV